MSDAPVRLHRRGRVSLAALPPLSLYVHLPWCLRKCPYCDFNSHPASPGALPEAEYLDALRADLEAALPLVWGRRVASVFIGGGTPSLFSPAGIDRLLADVRARLPLEPGIGTDCLPWLHEAGVAAVACDNWAVEHLGAESGGRLPVTTKIAGEILAAGTTVVTVGDLYHPWVRAYISEKDKGRVKLGDSATVTTDSFPGKTYNGRVTFISSEAEFTPKQIQTQEERVKLVYRVKIEVANPNQELKSNMPVDAEIKVQQ